MILQIDPQQFKKRRGVEQIDFQVEALHLFNDFDLPSRRFQDVSEPVETAELFLFHTGNNFRSPGFARVQISCGLTHG